ncbi:sensor domain-containing diguanylate cyclase [Thermovirga sp.]|uniref:sensor domain-containing diguanylate cyclase n=1 Tax=Thermovirga sp. TaxID=2699834 RepID=UPI0025D5AD13|nr:sensor domain-containing diguanylate cyclase [Thermovirga sp.]MBO8153698.1 GGDEF domain-containing protein [Thermovirga sp.]
MINLKDLICFCEEIEKHESIPSVAQYVVETIEKVLQGCYACFYVLSENQKQLVLLAYGSYSPELYSIERKNTLYWKALIRKETVVLDCSLIPKEILSVCNATQKIIVPIVWEQRLMGALVVESLKNLPEESIELLEFMATIAAKSMSFIKLKESLATSLDALASLNKKKKLLVDVSLKLFEYQSRDDIGEFLIDKIRDVFGFVDVSLLWADSKREDLSKGSVDSIRESQKTKIILPFTIKATDPSEMAVAIKYEDTFWGTLFVKSPSGKAINKRDGELLSSLCSYFAAILTTRSQFKKLARMRRMERAFLEIIIEAAGKDSIEEICGYVVKKLNETALCQALVYKISTIKDKREIKVIARGESAKIFEDMKDNINVAVGNSIDVPIAFEGKVFGILRIMDRQGYFSNKEGKDMLSILARHLGILWGYKEIILKTKHEALRDSLTGLWNRKYFSMKMEEELERCKRYGGTFALVMVDLRDFKAINDTFGHLEGDRLLIELALLLEMRIRKSDIIARYGGDEFVAFHPQTSLEKAVRLWEKISKEIESNLWGSRGLKMAIDFGVASCPEDGVNIDSLLKKADKRMYESKNRAKMNLSKG